MQKLYQTSWHRIPFTSFSSVSLDRIAGMEFYEKFYTAFFKRYSRLSDLDPNILRLKQATIEGMFQTLFPSKQARILSVGCGLGLIEMFLWKQGYLKLDVTEISDAPLRWVRETIPSDHIFVGRFPECLPQNRQFDVILLSGVDYTFEDAELSYFLSAVLDRLTPGGTCTLLAYSLEPSSRLQRVWTHCRAQLELLLNTLRKPGQTQFWGYLRRREEYQSLLRAAGFQSISDELIPTGTSWTTYRITGRQLEKGNRGPS